MNEYAEEEKDTMFGDQDEFTTELDLSGKKTESDLGRSYVPAGRYHAQLVKLEKSQRTVKSTNAVQPLMQMTFRIKAPRTGPDGRPLPRMTHMESVPLTDAFKSKLEVLAARFGLLGADHYDNPKAVVRWSRALNKHVVIELEDNEYTGNDGKTQKNTRLSWTGVFPIDHKDVADVPKDMDALAEDGIVLPDAPADGELPGKPDPMDNV